MLFFVGLSNGQADCKRRARAGERSGLEPARSTKLGHAGHRGATPRHTGCKSRRLKWFEPPHYGFPYVFIGSRRKGLEPLRVLFLAAGRAMAGSMEAIAGQKLGPLRVPVDDA